MTDPTPFLRPAWFQPPAYWEELEAYCLSFPGAFADTPWDTVVFRVPGRKIFVFTSGKEPTLSVWVKVPADLRPLMLQQPGVSVAPYVGRFGWLAVRVADDAGWSLAQDLIAGSYAMNAPKRKRRPAAPPEF